MLQHLKIMIREIITSSATDSTDKHVEEPKNIYKAPNIPTDKRMKNNQNIEEESPMLKEAFVLKHLSRNFK